MKGAKQMVLDTEAEKILSAKRAGARAVRKAIQKQIASGKIKIKEKVKF